MTTIPQKVYDLLGTLDRIPADPDLGWPRTVIGIYEDVAAAMNADPMVMKNNYTVAEVAQALTWVHEHGPADFQATVPKVGPGRPPRREFIDADGNIIEVEGHIFMLIGANQPVDAEVWDVISTGLISWGRYVVTAAENDMTALNLYASVLPNDTWGRQVTQAIAKVSRKKQDVIDAVTDLIKSL